MKYRGRMSTPEQFSNIVIRSLADGQVLRLCDVARVELGSDAYNSHTGMDGHPTAMLTIQQTAGSNASAIINEINAAVKQMSGDLPEGIHFQKINDAKRYLDASIHTVVETLLEAILLVILVAWVFLQDLRSTFIPSVSIVVSLIGTFAFMQLMGFSLNLLTLFALVLAIGTVVDDAIIMVEAVQTNFDRGYRSPYLSSTDAMHNVAMALLTSTIVFMAVFIPVSMIGGTSGAFYRQFGLTMAAAVGISAINAFTLSPALFALLLLMTVLTMLLGMLLLMMATGAGANGGRSLASCVVGGMTLGILALLFLVPALFIIFQWLQERMMPRKMVEL